MQSWAAPSSPLFKAPPKAESMGGKRDWKASRSAEVVTAPMNAVVARTAPAAMSGDGDARQEASVACRVPRYWRRVPAYGEASAAKMRRPASARRGSDGGDGGAPGSPAWPACAHWKTKGRSSGQGEVSAVEAASSATVSQI